MQQRAYTLNEIDDMRHAIATTILPSYQGPAQESTRIIAEQARRAEIEDKLRTYMTAGVDPVELIAWAKDKSEQLWKARKGLYSQ